MIGSSGYNYFKNSERYFNQKYVFYLKLKTSLNPGAGCLTIG